MAVKFDCDTSGDFPVSAATIGPFACKTLIMVLSSQITAILTDWVNRQPLTNPVMCLGSRPVMGFGIYSRKLLQLHNDRKSQTGII